MSLLGVLSDAHGNVDAFDRCIQVLRGLGATEFVFIGDSIGYIPSAEVVGRLMALDDRVRCVMGNHEALLLRGEIDEDRDRVYQLTRIGKMLSDSQIRFLAAWPTMLQTKLGRYHVTFVHGSPVDPTYGYVYPDTDLTPFGSPADYFFMGNSHRPFVRWSNDCCFINVGSCGLPRDDGSYGAAATFNDQTGAVEVYRFDIEAANDRLLHQTQALHASVIAVMLRRSKEIYGTHV
ncbi:MAG: metallophosphoesterase family protein [Rubrivivax sp.]|nr:metallophosphoesterase family protein [Rubrivivax sp.]MDP3082611.1 metallophosphoesterase family protein [Rubrivivax sp.]